MANWSKRNCLGRERQRKRSFRMSNCTSSSACRSCPKPAAKAALDRAGLVSEMVVEPDAGHAFFHDGGPRYNAAAAADAWRRMLDWFGRYLS